MMDSSLKERFARLGPTRVIDRVSSGSPAVYVLRVPPVLKHVRTIDGMFALARRGFTMLQAKRAIEAMLDDGRVFVDLPMVESDEALTTELARAGITAAAVVAPPAIDVRSLRERLRLTPEQFALRYGFERDTLQRWEDAPQEIDTAARSYLRAIANDPQRVEEAYAPTPPFA